MTPLALSLLWTAVQLSWAAWWATLHRRIRRAVPPAAGEAALRRDPVYKLVSPALYLMQQGLCVAAFWSDAPGLLKAPVGACEQPLRAGGFGVLLGASLLYSWAVRHLGENYAPCYASQRPRQLVTTGPYRFLRHPMYVAKLLVGLATLMISDSAWFVPTTFYFYHSTLRAALRENRELASLLVVAACGIGLGACATTPPLVRPDMTQADRESLHADFRAERQRVNKAVKPLFETANKTPIAKPFFWTIRAKDDARVVGYLLGTIHLGVNIKDLPKEVRQRLGEAKIVATETGGASIEHGEDTDLVDALMSSGGTTQEKPERSIGSASRPALANFEREMAPINPDYVERFSPSSAFALFKLVKSVECPGWRNRMLDDQIEKQAVKAGKDLRGLETTAEIIEGLKGGSTEAGSAEKPLTLDEFNAKFSHDATAEVVAVCKELVALVQNYRDGDRSGELANERNTLGPAAYDLLIRDRNQRWLPRIARMLDVAPSEGPAFIAVGVGHMMGPASLVSLLEQRGYHLSKAAPAANPS